MSTLIHFSASGKQRSFFQAGQLLQDVQLLAAACVGALQEASTRLGKEEGQGDEYNTDEQCRLLQAEMHALLATAMGHIEVSEAST